MMEIVVIGGGGHAKVLVNTLKKLGEYSILGYTDGKDNGSLLGVRYLGGDDILDELLKTHPGCCAAIGVGNVAADDKREKIMKRMKDLKFSLPSIVSPRAVVNEDVAIGSGTVVFDGAIINPGTEIGEGVIVNTNCTVEHDCRIEDFVHIASNAALSGGARVGRRTMIGAGATVLQSVTICGGCTIGAGAVVVEDCLRPGTYLGVPARMKQ
jgi:UDP-perosamine 4-acetyltransferase